MAKSQAACPGTIHTFLGWAWNSVFQKHLYYYQTKGVIPLCKMRIETCWLFFPLSCETDMAYTSLLVILKYKYYGGNRPLVSVIAGKKLSFKYKTPKRISLSTLNSAVFW